MPKIRAFLKPIAYRTSANERLYDICMSLPEPPQIFAASQPDLPLYRVWSGPAEAIECVGLSNEPSVVINPRFYICIPGLAGYPYEGGLPMAEYAEDEVLVVEKSNFHRLFIDREYKAKGVPFLGRCFDGRFFTNANKGKGKVITPEDIAAFKVPNFPQTRGMCLTAYGRWAAYS